MTLFSVTSEINSCATEVLLPWMPEAVFSFGGEGNYAATPQPRCAKRREEKITLLFWFTVKCFRIRVHRVSLFQCLSCGFHTLPGY